MQTKKIKHHKWIHRVPSKMLVHYSPQLITNYPLLVGNSVIVAYKKLFFQKLLLL